MKKESFSIAVLNSDMEKPLMLDRFSSTPDITLNNTQLKSTDLFRL